MASRNTWAPTALFALAIFASSALHVAAQSAPGWPAPPYRVEDHDPYLTGVARDGLPLIKAVEAFRDKYRHCPELQDQAALAPLLPPGATIVAVFNGGFVLSRGEAALWVYQFAVEGQLQCSLSRKLSWDPDLVYRFDGASGGWFYAPGDGDDDIPLRLDP